MNSSPFSSASKHNRRGFLKAQTIFALGVCTTGISISETRGANSILKVRVLILPIPN